MRRCTRCSRAPKGKKLSRQDLARVAGALSAAAGPGGPVTQVRRERVAAARRRGRGRGRARSTWGAPGTRRRAAGTAPPSAARPRDDKAGTLRDIFCRLAHALHPDRAGEGGDADARTEAMKDVNRAYREGDLASLVEIQRTWALARFRRAVPRRAAASRGRPRANQPGPRRPAQGPGARVPGAQALRRGQAVGWLEGARRRAR